MPSPRPLRFLAAAAFTAALAACGDVITGPDGDAARSVRALQLGEASLVLDEGATRALPVTLLDQQRRPFAAAPDGTHIEWASSDPDVVSVTEAGVLTAHRAGAARVTATVTSVLGQPSVAADVEVRAAVQHLELASGDAQRGVVGTRLAEPLAVRVTSAAGTGVAGVTVSFVAEEMGAAAITAITDAEGVARLDWTLGITAGSQTIVATTTRLPDAVVRFGVIAVADLPRTISIARGSGQAGVVDMPLPEPVVTRVVDQHGNPVPGAVVTFAPADGHGTVSVATPATDALGEAAAQWRLGRVAGEMSLEAGIEGLEPARFHASAVPGAGSTVTVTPATVAMGALQRQVPLAAAARDAFGNVIAGATFDWSVVDGAVAQVDAAGVVQSRANGSTLVQATLRGTSVRGEAALTVAQVPASLTLSAPATPVVVGATGQAALVARDSTGNAISAELVGTVTWRSSNESVATVDAAGVVTGRMPGRATISATIGAVTGTLELSVTPAGPVAVHVTPDTVRAGSLRREIQFAAVAVDAFGNVVPDAIIDWAISDTVASVINQTGLVRTTGNGTSRVRVNVRGTALRDTAYLVVRQYVDSIKLGRPTEGVIAIGASERVYAATFDSSGALIEPTSRREAIAWSSSNPAVATVDQTGFVTGVAAGTAIITAAAGTGQATHEVTVGVVTASMTLVSDPNPTAPASFYIRDRVVVQLRDPQGQVMAGQRIEWNPHGDAYIRNEMGTTDAQGYASAEWGLNDVEGVQQLTVAAPAAPGAPSVTVTATATPRPQTVQVISGAGQRVRRGQRTAEPIVFRVLDRDGAPVPNVGLDHSFGTGGIGDAEATADATDADGRIGYHVTIQAGSTLYLGAYGAGGTQYASSQASVVVVDALDDHEGNDQEGAVGRQLTDMLAVRVYDAQARPVPGQLVSWSTPHGGTLTPSNGGLTDADGWARAQWVLGPTVGEQTAIAQTGLSDGMHATTFNAIAREGEALSCAIDGGTVHTGDITQPGTWTAAASPHRVTGLVRVLGVKLTIEPGALVCAEYDDEWQEGYLRFEQGAILDARGTAERPIVIGSTEWNRLRGFDFRSWPTDTSRLAYVMLSNVHQGLIATDGHAVVIEDSGIWSTSYTGARLQAPGSRLVRSTVGFVAQAEMAAGVEMWSGTSLIDTHVENTVPGGVAVSASGTGIRIAGSILIGRDMALYLSNGTAAGEPHDVLVEGSSIQAANQTIQIWESGSRLRITGSTLLLTGTASEQVLVRNYGELPVDLRGNWWGSSTGPDPARLAGWPVLYDPWLTSAPPAPTAGPRE